MVVWLALLDIQEVLGSVVSFGADCPDSFIVVFFIACRQLLE
jgi:hypothetical protein